MNKGKNFYNLASPSSITDATSKTRPRAIYIILVIVNVEEGIDNIDIFFNGRKHTISDNHIETIVDTADRIVKLHIVDVSTNFYDSKYPYIDGVVAILLFIDKIDKDPLVPFDWFKNLIAKCKDVNYNEDGLYKTIGGKRQIIPLEYILYNKSLTPVNLKL